MRSLNQEPKLVVYGILNPSSNSIKVMVTRTYPLNTESNIGLDDIYVDARVFIVDSESQDTVELQQLEANSTIYEIKQSEFDILPGSEYMLRIESEGFETVYASTKIPIEVINWTECELIESMVDDLEDYAQGFEIIGTWPKSDIENNQIVVFHLKESRDNGNGNIETRSYTKGIYVDFRETDHSFIFESPPFHIYKPDEFEPEDSYRWYVEEINAVLITTDIHLYNYISYYLLTENINNVMDGGSFLDLFRGIMPEFSNVEGGLGVFGSCMTDTAIIYRLNK
ncbi:MAG: DUF4249 domain-containing protein [Bacteroidales bacterium]|nr:DUF4249 domain-containing protein [Bacteroidales bacterium]